MKILLPLSILVLAAAGLAQSDLPETGKITDIQGKTKVYITANGEARKAMVKKIGDSSLAIVDKADDAEFFIEYITLSRQPFGVMLGMTTETGQLDVFIYRDKKKVIAWSDSQTGGGFKGDTAQKLLSKFLKAYKGKT